MVKLIPRLQANNKKMINETLPMAAYWLIECLLILLTSLSMQIVSWFGCWSKEHANADLDEKMKLIDFKATIT